MKYILWICLLLCLPTAYAYAESAEEIAEGIDLSSVQEIADAAEYPVQVRETVEKLLRGELFAFDGDMLSTCKEILLSGMRNALAMLSGILAPTLLSALAGRLLGDTSGAEGVQYACRLSCAAILANLFFGKLSSVRTLIGILANLSKAIAPILAGLAAMTGAANTSSMLTPTAALFADGISELASTWGVGLSAAAAGLAAAGNLNRRFSLKRLFSLTRSIVNDAAGLATALFPMALSVQGMFGESFDGMTMRTARYAVDSAIPVIGGSVAEAMDAMVSSARLVKGAVGVTGMLVVLSVCVEPILELLALRLVLGLAAALMEPVAEAGMTEMTEQFAKATDMLLVVSTAIAVMLLILLGAALRIGAA